MTEYMIECHYKDPSTGEEVFDGRWPIGDHTTPEKEASNAIARVAEMIHATDITVRVFIVEHADLR